MSVRTRFAPSPSGHLHVGGARTALFCWAFARGRNGKFILRIEDTDQKRSSDAASVGFLKDLAWLGIFWDEGPVLEQWGGGEFGPYFQSERLPTYDRYLKQLVDEGKAYYAFDTTEELTAQREDAKRRGVPYRYDRTASVSRSPEAVAALLAEGRPAVIRLKSRSGPVTIHDEVLGDATLPDGEMDDFVIRKADGFPTYHFAVVVDDERMGVTHVLRAQEHFNNTAKHMLLQDALGFRRPIYAHLPIISNPDGSKMSKRDKDKALRAAVRDQKITQPPAGTVEPATFTKWVGDKNIQLEFDDAIRLATAIDVSLPEINVDDFRRSGYLPEVLCNFLALNGWSPGHDREKFDNEFLKGAFDLDRVIKTPAKFDRTKLLAFNLDAIQAMSVDDFTKRVREHGAEFHPDFLKRMSEEQFRMLVAASRERSKTLDDVFRTNRFFLLADDAVKYEDAKAVRKNLLGEEPNGMAHLEAVAAELQAVVEWTPAAIEAAVGGYVAKHAEGQLGRVAQPLRIAVSGGTISPPIYETLAILGKESTLRRIQHCRKAVQASVSSSVA